MNETKMIETFGPNKCREKLSICPLILDQDLQKCCPTSINRSTKQCVSFSKESYKFLISIAISKEQPTTYVILSLEIIDQHCFLNSYI